MVAFNLHYLRYIKILFIYKKCNIYSQNIFLRENFIHLFGRINLHDYTKQFFPANGK